MKICASHAAVIPDESYTALSTDEERLRSISQLQQKVQALETAKTERTRAQNSLRSKQSELADLLENAVEGVQQVGRDQKIQWANRALLHLLGYSRASTWAISSPSSTSMKMFLPSIGKG